MHVSIAPSKARGVMAAPPSKSMSHRLLICAGLASGETSVLRGIAPSQDLLATMDCLRALGARVAYDGETAEITGVSFEAFSGGVLPCRECGTALRLLIPAALLSGKRMTFTGSAGLISRPTSVYADMCRERDFEFNVSETAITVCGRLSPGVYRIPGDVSSQFISGLCLALPLLSGDSAIEITTQLQSRPYVDMTLGAMNMFGVSARFTDGRIELPGGQRYSGRDAEIEGDYSNAAVFDALNILDGSVTLTGLRPDSLQGDRVYPELFDRLRAGTPVIDLSDCPDLGPMCMALAAALHGARFTGTRRLRYKESDRVGAMAEELSKFGVRCGVSDDGVTVYPARLRAPSEPLCGRGDHRVVMALALLATVTGGALDGAEAVEKSVPDFFERLERLGIEIKSTGGECAR